MQSKLEGMYLILLRIEAVDDARADSNLAEVGAGAGVVHSGAVAGFALPTLRYFVGSGGTVVAAQNKLELLLPAENDIIGKGGPIDFTWSEIEGAAYYGLDVQDASGGAVISAVVLPGTGFYRAPSWLKDRVLKDKASGGEINWKVAAFDESGKRLGETARRVLRLAR